MLGGLSDGNVTFENVTNCALKSVGSKGSVAQAETLLTSGYYDEALDRWTNKVPRRNLLVVSYESFANDGGATMEAITTHYGMSPKGSISLQSKVASALPSPHEVSVVKCDTLKTLRAHFMPHNDALLRRLRHERESGSSPEDEVPFPAFEVRVPCGQMELTGADKYWIQKQEPKTVTESDDQMLTRLGIFDYVKPRTHILFGVITGKGMEERYGSIARTWCGDLKACVYFSNETSAPSAEAPTVTVDIVQDMLELHQYPRWSVRSEDHWPVYRSAQLRFIPALHWLRSRMLADKDVNPRTHEHFGHANWVLLVDDDTFVFHDNLMNVLSDFNPKKPIYTGMLSPPTWIPTNLTFIGHDTQDLDGNVNSWDPFITGGSGSIFSAEGLKQLNTSMCVQEMSPTGKWWQFQSDWALGSCAKASSMMPSRITRESTFAQFVCLDKQSVPFHCRTMKERDDNGGIGGMLAWDADPPLVNAWSVDDPLSTHQATMHPIKNAATFDILWNAPMSRWLPEEALEAGHHKQEQKVEGDSSEALGYVNSCHRADSNPDALDAFEFCDGKNGCWPAMWLLGAQKAATSAIYDTLLQCGGAAGAWPERKDIGTLVPSFCEQPCKETHIFTSPFDGPGYRRFPVLSNETVTAYTRMHYGGDMCLARPTSWERDACTNARFIEGTPSTDYPYMPQLLAQHMPTRLMMKARFVVLMREPVERMLSWYNQNNCPSEFAHGAPWDKCAVNSTFHDFVQCRQKTVLNKLPKDPKDATQQSWVWDAGMYGHFTESLLSTGVPRKHVLLLNYRDTFGNTSSVTRTIRVVSRHFGGAIFDRVETVPQTNVEDFAGKVKMVKCETRDALAKNFEADQEKLYAITDQSYADGTAPEYEPHFGRMTLELPCSDFEKTAAQIEADERAGKLSVAALTKLHASSDRLR